MDHTYDVQDIIIYVRRYTLIALKKWLTLSLRKAESCERAITNRTVPPRNSTPG